MSKKKKSYRQKAQRGRRTEGGGKTKQGRVSEYENNSQPIGKKDNQSIDQGLSSQELEVEDLAKLIFQLAQDMGLIITQKR